MITDSLAALSLDELLGTAAELGIEQLEFAAGNWSQAPHLMLDRMLDSAQARQEFTGKLRGHGISISALLPSRPASPCRRRRSMRHRRRADTTADAGNIPRCSCLFSKAAHIGREHAKAEQGMKGRLPSRQRDAEIRRFTQTAATRKRRLPPLSPSEPAAPLGTAPDPTEVPPVEITDETASPSIIQPGLRQYNAPTLQQPFQPWLDQSDTPLPLKVSEEQGQGQPPAQFSRLATILAQASAPGVRQKSLVELLLEEGKLVGLLPRAAQAQQRPAAYRFALRDGKIGVLPEPPEPQDREFAVDTYDELVGKARELQNRLTGTNSARRVCNSVERLLLALGTRLDDLRPGLLLSRSRSLEADRAAFADELFPDAVALMDDALRTLRDLLAAFPIVRHIEAEGLALQLDRNADAIPAVQQEMNAVKVAATQSGAVTEEALDALAQNDAAIEEALDPVARTGLIADKLLVVGNLARAVLDGVAICGRIVGTELGEVAGKSWRAIKDDLPKGIGTAARVAPLVGLVTLAVVIGGPMGSIAAVVPVFKPIADTLRKMTANMLKDAPDGGDVKGDHPKAKGRGKSR
jgi:hypothetical protein